MSNKEILDIKGLLEGVKEVIIDNIIDKGHNASGNAIRSLEVRIDGDDGEIVGASYIPYLEKGSKPNSISYSDIHRWAKTKGIISGDDTESRKISGAIAHSILKRGTKAYQIGGEDIWSSAINDFINNNLNNYIKLDDLWPI